MERQQLHLKCNCSAHIHISVSYGTLSKERRGVWNPTIFSTLKQDWQPYFALVWLYSFRKHLKESQREATERPMITLSDLFSSWEESKSAPVNYCSSRALCKAGLSEQQTTAEMWEVLKNSAGQFIAVFKKAWVEDFQILIIIMMIV